MPVISRNGGEKRKAIHVAWSSLRTLAFCGFASNFSLKAPRDTLPKRAEASWFSNGELLQRNPPHSHISVRWPVCIF